jgi:streptogramin lyase
MTGSLVCQVASHLQTAGFITGNQKIFYKLAEYKSLNVPSESNNGLPSNMVYYAMQDSKGFIWFGTEAGACRFDGINFQPFTIDDGISDNEILQIYEDSKGRIWFLALNGRLSYFYNDKIYNTENDSVLKRASLNITYCMLLEDRKGNIWISTYSRTIIKISTDNKIEKLIPPDSSSSLSRMYLYENEKGEVLVFTGAKVYNITDHGFELRFEKLSPLSKGGYVFPLPGSKALFGGMEGIELFANGKFELIIPARDIPSYYQILRMKMNER